MKKVIFLMGITAFYFISCTSTKKNISTTSKQDYYQNNSYADSFLSCPELISGDLAMAYINKFRNHVYKGWRKKRLLNAWSTFDCDILNKITNDPRTDSIFFFLAAYLKNDPDKDQRKHPFVILEAKPKSSLAENGKGDAAPETTVLKPLFFVPVKICPPPDNGCRVPGS